jgi:hypothetical protein
MKIKKKLSKLVKQLLKKNHPGLTKKKSKNLIKIIVNKIKKKNIIKKNNQK